MLIYDFKKTNSEKIIGKVTEVEWRHDFVSEIDDDTIHEWMTKRKG